MTIRLLLLLSFALALPALEVIEEPAWLSKTMTPSWRQVRLGAVLDDLGTTSGCPVKQGEDLADIAQGHEVTIILTAPTTLRRALELIEQTQDLVITAEPHQMTVVRFATWRVAARRAITIDMRDFASLIDFPEPDPDEAQRQVPRVLAPDGRPVIGKDVSEHEPDASEAVEYLRGLLSRGEEPPKLELWSGYRLVATVNPHEERILRRELARLASFATWTSTWNTTFGIIPNGLPLESGVLSHAAADALRQRLLQRKDLLLVATEQRSARVSDQRQQELMTSAEHAGDSLMPIAEILTTGFACELTPIAGRGRHLLRYQLSWSEPRPGSTATLIVPPIPADPTKNQAPGGDQTLSLAKPAVWSWEPGGDVYLPDHHALVLIAPHANGHAVIVIESKTASNMSSPGDEDKNSRPIPPKVSLTVKAEPTLLAIDRLAALAHVGVAIHHNAQQIVREEAEISLMDQSWTQALKSLWMLRCDARLEDDHLRIEEHAGSRASRVEHRLFSTATLTTWIGPRPGPRLGVQKIAQNQEAPELVLHGVHRNNDISDFVEEIQSQVDPESWSNEGVGIETYNGSMVVDQSPEVHHIIERFIAEREQRAARHVMVRLYRVSGIPAEAGPVLDATDWKAAAGTAQPEAAFLTIDGKRNHHFSGVRRAYLAADYFANGLGSPVMGMSTSGLVIEVEPHITVTGITAQVRLQATVSDSMTTSPVKDAAGRLLFDIDLPDQRIDQADDVRLIPPGGAALYRFDDRTYAVSVEALIP